MATEHLPRLTLWFNACLELTWVILLVLFLLTAVVISAVCGGHDEPEKIASVFVRINSSNELPLVDDGGTTEDPSRIIAGHEGRLPWKLIHQ